MKTPAIFTILVIIFLIPFSQDQACTIFKMKANDGNTIVTRSMEFGVDLKYDLIVVPRNKSYSSPSPVSKTGLKWSSKLGYIGVTCFGLEEGITDGMNEKGLSVSVLWYESDTRYETVAPADSSRAIAQIYLPDWLLGNFSTVDEARSGIGRVKVYYLSSLNGMSFPVTIHYIIYDANGNCIVVEYDKGRCNIYDNPLGIMTNAPSFPWHMTNLRQYLGMENTNPIPIKSGGFSFSPTGHGDGMFGIPGDLTPPSRFVRLAMFDQFVTRQPDAASNLNLCQHIIDTFTIPFGVIVDKDATGKVTASESTQWVTFRDITNRVFYFKTYDNPTLRKISLDQLDFNAGAIRRIPMYGTSQTIQDVTK